MHYLLYGLWGILFLGATTAQAQPYLVKKNKNLYGVWDKKNKTAVVPFEYNYIEEVGLSGDHFLIENEEHYTIVNHRYEPVFDWECDSIVSSGPAYADYRLYKDGKQGYYSFRDVVIPIAYDSIRRFRAFYADQKAQKMAFLVSNEGRFGVLDKKGAWYRPLEYEAIGTAYKDYLPLKKDGQWLGMEGDVVQHRGDSVLFFQPEYLSTFPTCSSHVDQDSALICQTRAFNAFILEHIRYPEDAQLDKVDGMVVVEYWTEADGTVSHVDMIRGNRDYFASEIKRLEMLLPKMNPARQDGKAVRHRWVLPIRFKLR